MLSQDFREFIESLNENNVRYLVVGGYAVAFHGHPRYTKDLDIWIGRSAENVEQLLEALEDFGFGSLGLVPQDFLEPDQVIQLGYPPNRIDILNSLAGLDFEECYNKKVKEKIDGIQTNFLDIRNLRKNKIASGRPQDLADAESLKF